MWHAGDRDFAFDSKTEQIVKGELSVLNKFEPDPCHIRIAVNVTFILIKM
jgi:hypothetical protein